LRGRNTPLVKKKKREKQNNGLPERQKFNQTINAYWHICTRGQWTFTAGSALYRK